MRISIIVLLLTFSLNLIAQDFGAVEVKDLKGASVEMKSIVDHDGPVVISFWATWCKPCILELNAVSEELDTWIEDTNVKFVAVSIDDARTAKRVLPFVTAKDWPFDVFLDENGDLKRTMGVTNVPHSFIYCKGEIIWQHSGYTPGDEEDMLEQLEACGD
jgi:cytochrome c biogenesis protein CcmG/thiol:disulfide interchange protein DsbE